MNHHEKNRKSKNNTSRLLAATIDETLKQGDDKRDEMHRLIYASTKNLKYN